MGTRKQKGLTERSDRPCPGGRRRGTASCSAPGSGVQVYDRSPLCTLALARYLQRPVTPLLADEVNRVINKKVYERSVFFVRLLGFIAPTQARRISYPDSLQFEAIPEAVYREHGYRLLDVPAGTISERAAAIAGHISSQTRPMPSAPAGRTPPQRGYTDSL